MVIAATAALVGLGACATAAIDDPLASTASQVAPELVEPPVLVPQWLMRFVDTEDEPEVPTRPPALGRDMVFVAYGERLRALEIRDGAHAWTASVDGAVVAGPLAVATGVLLATEQRWYWFDRRGVLQATLEVSDPLRDSLATRDGAYVADEAGIAHLQLHAEPYRLEIDWRSARADVRRIAQHGGLIVAVDTAAVTAFDAASGAQRWAISEVAPALAPTAALGERIFVAGHDSRIRAYRLSDGRPLWTSKEIGVEIQGGPAAVDDVVWVAGREPALHGFTVSGGSHLFRVPLSARSTVDLRYWTRWIIASPRYGPWTLVRAPLTTTGPGDPGLTRTVTIASDDDLMQPPDVAAHGAVVVDASGAIRLLVPERPPLDATPDGGLD